MQEVFNNTFRPSTPDNSNASAQSREGFQQESMTELFRSLPSQKLSGDSWKVQQENLFVKEQHRLPEMVLAEADASSLGKRFRMRLVPGQYQNALIAEALRLSGHRADDSEIRYARALINTESTFDAGLVNTWDSNARAGHPSKGWAQVIDSTFRYYHVSGHSDIWNPVDNLAAGIRYADATYGYLDGGRNGLRFVAVHRSMRGLGY